MQGSKSRLKIYDIAPAAGYCNQEKKYAGNAPKNTDRPDTGRIGTERKGYWREF